jgi:hypothetical protein
MCIMQTYKYQSRKMHKNDLEVWLMVVVSSTLWVAILLGYNTVNVFEHFHLKTKIINFLVFVNIIVRSLDFVCENVSYIHEFI